MTAIVIDCWHLVIFGAPRTKKNHGSRIQRGRKRYNIPSEAWTEWLHGARIQLVHACEYWPERYRSFNWLMRPVTPKFALIDEAIARTDNGVNGVALPRPGRLELNCRALIYRDARRGDAVGYYQGIADLLQHLCVLTDDRMLVSWDGSRLLLDPEHPRVDVVLEPVGHA